MPGPLLIINAVGLTSRWLPYAPALSRLAQNGWCVPFRDVSPAVTCTAQATLLTGELPNRHGIVANGWLFRDTNEVRFWQQSNALLNAEPLYAKARRRAAERGRSFKSAKLFWWFNQGAAVDLAVTPKPHYGIDGSKHFDIATSPPGLGARLKRSLGPFPFTSFWGPMSGERSTQWIAAAASLTLLENRPDLTLVYLPHLDYDPQRRGPAGCDMARHVGELDRACAPLLEAAQAVGARVWVVSEYGHVDVTTPVYINRVLRRAGLLEVRPGPFGEQLDLYSSRAYAVCDHQLAHVYVRVATDRPRVVELLRGLSGVDGVFAGDERAELALDNSRAGEIVVLSRRDSWFAYPFWLDDRNAPDYARCVAIHHKPGFDPCELFFDPAKWLPKLRVAGKLARKTLGFRMKMDVIPLDAAIVRGSHGLAATDDADRPIWIGDGARPGPGPMPMTAFNPAVLEALGLGE